MGDRARSRDGTANWRNYQGGTAEKTRLVLRNTWRKVRTRSTCCGNHGEPGC